jgi:cytochrome P450
MDDRSPFCPVVTINAERDDGMRRNHLEAMRALRQHGPLFFSPIGGYGKGMYVVTAYQLFREIARNPRQFSNRYINLAAPVAPPAARSLIPEQLDPPDHARYRKLLSPWFSAAAVAALGPRIRTVCAAIVDDVAGRAEIDFASDVARRYPGSVFLEIFGLPVNRLRELTDTTWEMTHLDEHDDPGGGRRRAAAERLRDLLTRLAADRRAEPRDDIASALARSVIDGRPVTDEEVIDMLFLLVLAGLDAVAALLIYAMHHLAEHPADRARVARDRDIVPAATEELLRCFASAPVSRVATMPSVVGGCPVQPDDRFYMNVVMPNHDPAVFEEPDEVRVDRSPNQHMAFGFGVHHCLGSHLARAEIRVFLEEWHRRIPDYCVPDGAVIVDSPVGVAAFESLPLALGTG